MGRKQIGGYLKQPLTKNSNTIIPLSELQDQQIKFDNGLLHDIKILERFALGSKYMLRNYRCHTTN